VAAFARQMKVGNGFDRANALGPLISEEQRSRVERLIATGPREGAKLLSGGQRPQPAGWFIEPTVFADCRPDMTLVREEIFGPVVAIQTFGDGDLEAIAAQANDTVYGLSASIWTRDLATAHRMSRLIDAGQVGVNCHAAMDPSMPFGGNRQSGWGREFGEEGLELYLKTKAVTVTW
jgi:phenylacetaldehyde dehydrogenase